MRNSFHTILNGKKMDSERILKCCPIWRAVTVVMITILSSLNFQANDLQSYFSNRYGMRNVTMTNGFPHNFVDDIHKDSNGFLWLAFAGGGLARFDGRDVITFTSNTNRNNIKSNFVYNIEEDNFGRLWIASEGGVDVVNIKTMKNMSDYILRNIRHGAANKTVRSVFCDTKGNIWLQCKQRIIHLTFDTSGEINSQSTIKIPDNYVEAIPFEDLAEDGCPIAGISGKLLKLTPVSGGKIIAKEYDPRLNLEPGIVISDILSKDNNLWIASDKGLFKFSTLSGITKHYTSNTENEKTLLQNFITGLTTTHDGLLLASSLKGLNIHDTLEDCFIRVKDVATASPSGPSPFNLINCIHSFDDMIVVGTEGNGLFIFYPRDIEYTLYHKGFGIDTDHLCPVNSIFDDNRNNIWIGMVGGGLFMKRNSDKEFIRIMADNHELNHNSLSAMMAGPEGHIWIGTWGEGIVVIDPVSHTVVDRIQKNYPNNSLDFIGVLEYDRKNNGVWIGTNKGIWFYDMRTSSIAEVFKGSGNLRNGSIGSLIDSKNRLWIGGTQGYYMFDLNSRDKKGYFKYRHITSLHSPYRNPDAFHASSFLEDKKGRIWIGSIGKGIFILSSTNGKETYKNLTTANGLPSDMILGLLSDNNGNIWASTYNGLAAISSDGLNITKHYLTEKEPANQFFWNSSLRSDNGILYFGNGIGLVALNGININRATTLASPEISYIWVDNHLITAYDQESVDKYLNDGKLRLHESNRSFSVKLSSLNIANPESDSFQYKLEGFDKEWNTLPPNQQTITYTNLNAGKYKLLFRHSADNVFDDTTPISEMEVVITPYFYKRPWVIILTILLIITLIWKAYDIRTKALINQKKILEDAVERSTQEIQRQKSLVEQHAHQLSQRNEALMKTNIELSKHKGRLIQMTQDIKAEYPTDKLDDANSKFFNLVMSVLKDNYKNPNFDVKEFAAALGMSRSLLNKKLHETVGQPASHLLKTYRLSTARELIRKASADKSMNISEIAYEVGFNDSKYFTRCFTQHYSIAPSKLMTADRTVESVENEYN